MENQSKTDHQEYLDDSPAIDYILYIISLGMLAFIISFSNLVVLYTICKNRRLHVPNNILVAGMALADATFGLVGIPFHIMVYSIHIGTNYLACLFINSFYLILRDVPVSMLLTMTFDRLLATCLPDIYVENIECKHPIIVVIVIWVVSICLTCVPVWKIQIALPDNYHVVCSYREVMSPDCVNHYAYIGIRWSYVLIIILVNVYVFTVMRRQVEQRRILNLRSLPSETDAEIMLIIMVVVFLVTNIPLDVVNSIETCHKHQQMYGHTVMRRVFTFVYFSKSLINPLICAYSNKKLYASIRNVVLCGHGFFSVTFNSTVTSVEAPTHGHEENEMNEIPDTPPTSSLSATSSESLGAIESMSSSILSLPWTVLSTINPHRDPGVNNEPLREQVSNTENT